MALDLQYQAFPHDSGLIEFLLELMETDADAAESVQFIPWWTRAEPPGPTRLRDPQVEPVWQWCLRRLKTHPDLGSRNLFLDRNYDKLHYLLSAKRRTDNGSAAAATVPDTSTAAFDDLIAHAFDRGAVVHPDLQTTQGFPIRWIPSGVVTAITDGIAHLEFRDLAVHFDPVRMDVRGVYKCHPTTDPEAINEELRSLERLFTRFKTFFIEARTRGECVLVIKD